MATTHLYSLALQVCKVPHSPESYRTTEEAVILSGSRSRANSTSKPASPLECSTILTHHSVRWADLPQRKSSPVRNVLQGESQVLMSVKQENRGAYCVSKCAAHCLFHSMFQFRIDSVWVGRILQGPPGQNKAHANLGPESQVQVDLSS